MAYPSSTPVSAGDTGKAIQYNNLRDDAGGIIGEIKCWAGATAPTSYLICDGAAISRATYADLFAITGTKYGVGDGSTTFNIPNLKGKLPVGLDSGITDFNDRGKAGGEKTHQLTIAELAAHTHDHRSGIAQGTLANTAQNAQENTVANLTASTGGDTAHENMPPYVIVNYIIKALLLSEV